MELLCEEADREELELNEARDAEENEEVEDEDVD